MTRGRSLLLAIALAATCTACLGENYRQRVPLPERLAWLHEGQTERLEVFERLGPPERSFENARIQTWSVGLEDEDEGYVAGHSLVLVFDATERLARASLVRLH